MILIFITSLLVGFLGSLIFISYLKNESLKEKNKNLEIENTRLNTLLQANNQSFEEKIATLRNVQGQLEEKLKHLAQEALSKSNQSFLNMAKEVFQNLYQTSKTELDHKEKKIQGLIEPIGKALTQVHEKMENLEKNRLSPLQAQIGEMTQIQNALRKETMNLSKAFNNPTSKGKWGEIHLKRVVELSGMREHCDFVIQNTSEQGLRPDMIINLPGEKSIIVDAKAPMSSYLVATECENESDRDQKYKEYTKQVRSHIKILGQKGYWQNVKKTPEFVVLFLPSEALFSKALEYDHELIDFGIGEKVILATPTTLIALLRTVFFAWQNEKIAYNVEEIYQLARNIYQSLFKLSEHFSKTGKALDGAVSSYNKTLRQLEEQLLPSTQKLQELKIFNQEKNLQFGQMVVKKS